MEDVVSNNEVSLSFIPFTEQNLNFKIYKKKYEEIESPPAHWYRTTLGTDLREECWVVLEPEESFTEYLFSGQENIGLTNRKIWFLLLAKIKTIFNNGDYVIPNERFLRQVSIIIGIHPEGNEVINLSPYYLKSHKKFGFLLDFEFLAAPGQKSYKIIQQLSLSLDRAGNSNKNYYSDKYDRVEHFIKKYFPMIFPLKLDEHELAIDTNFEKMKSDRLSTRVYLFENNKKNTSQFMGLRDNGPFCRLNANPYFVFIFEDAFRYAANDLFKALTGQSYPSTFPGMEKMFGIKFTTSDVTKVNIKDYERNELDKAIKIVDQIKIEKPNSNIIGVFIEHTRENSQSYPDGYSPYYYLKYLFTERHLPLQAVTIEKMTGRDGLKWSVSGIGLQLFAKLGGIPWTVQPSNEKCLILGIGSSHKINCEGKIEKYFAYSICVDSSGIYRSIDILGEANDESTYISQLSKNIQEILKRQISDNIRKFAIHLPFKIRRKEMACIVESVKTLPGNHQNIEFQFIKINTKNRFFGYADNNSKVPYESTYIQLAPSEYLVWFEGLLYGKENVFKRVANPVHIEFLASDYSDEGIRRKYLQDIINLSGANWRGFNAKVSPISIYYPSIIANYISEFRTYGNTDLDLTEVQIPWFL